jgi:hypothetical protein
VNRIFIVLVILMLMSGCAPLPEAIPSASSPDCHFVGQTGNSVCETTFPDGTRCVTLLREASSGNIQAWSVAVALDCDFP